MTLVYGVYGLRLTTTTAVPFLLPPIGKTGASDLALGFEEGMLPALRPEVEPWYCGPSAFEQSPELVAYHAPEAHRFWFRYDVGTSFDYESDGGRLTAYWRAPQTFEDTCTYLLGPILGFVLQLHHRVCLHASVVAIGNAGVAFVGPNGVGKSTLAAALLARGARIVTEDVAAVEERDGGFRVHFGPRAIRLWSPSVTALYGRPDALPPISKHWEKQYLPLDEPTGDWMLGVPLTTIYLLEVDSSDAPVVSRPLTPALAVGKLLANIYPGRLPLPEAQAVILDTLTRLVAALPIVCLFLPNSFSRLPEVCDYLLARHA
ncbi:MAG: hypothetical protein NZ585_02105 [Chloracidobacterium sp.]|nr:hypothetical protein [Chloracidobacterium sp.]MDW8215973.1 hypothetical protein [Acidobacteriota bacterium]